MALTSFLKWGQPPAVVCSACCKCSAASILYFALFHKQSAPAVQTCALLTEKARNISRICH